MVKPNAQRMNLLQRLVSLFYKEPQDRNQLINMLHQYESNALLDQDVLHMVEGALQVSEMQVKDIMIPYVQMVVIKNDADTTTVLEIMVGSGHSRFPVIDNDNNVMGILLAKDVLKYFSHGTENTFYIKDVMRPAFYVPESKSLNVLLKELRANRNHMAIVVDEYSSVAGLVTMEDVIEKIVGKIEDEHDIEDEEYIKFHGRQRYSVNALTPIAEFNNFFNIKIKDDECDTIGGIVLKAFGYVPKRGEKMEFEGFNVTVLKADKRRIHLMRMTTYTECDPLAGGSLPSSE